MASTLDLSQLTDSNLALKLKEHGLSVGPITPTTRAVFERKLDQLINGSKQNEEVKAVSIPVSSIQTVVISEKVSTTPKMYFAVQVPLDVRSLEENYILTDKKEALQLVKKYTGSRFKIFQCKDLAEHYINQPGDRIPASPKTETLAKNSVKPAGESSTFRGPKPPELVAYRRMLEQGNLEGVKTTVWGNPRYLISSGDTPTILQESFRYNALHVCSTKNQAGSAEVILNLLKDESLFKLMYPDDSINTRLERMTFITDLYLNTPDKGVNETPLHFACKFGHVEVVQVLLTHKVLDKERVNKFGEKPRDIVCNRMRSGSATTKQQIYSLLSEQCFVPLIRAVDDTEPPQVTSPVSPDHVTKTLEAEKYGSPKETPHTIRAMAGPMSPVQAEKFHRTWTTPPSPTLKDRMKYTSIRRGDPTKGLERIGRDLAHMLHIPWNEYWEFLDTFVDLSTPKGIDVLENYLREKGDLVSHELSLTDEVDSLGSLLQNLDLESQNRATKWENIVPGNNTVNKSLFGGVQLNHVQQSEGADKPNPFMPQSFINASLANDKQTSVRCDRIIGSNNNNSFTSDKQRLTESLVKSNDRVQNKRHKESVDDLISEALSGLSVKDNSQSADGSIKSIITTSSSDCDSTDNAFMVKKYLNSTKLDVGISRLSDERSDHDMFKVELNKGKGDISDETRTELSASSEISATVMENTQDISVVSVEDLDIDRENVSHVKEDTANENPGMDGYETDTESVESYHTATDSSDGEEEDVFEDSFDSTDGATRDTLGHIAFVYGREPSKADVDVLRAIEEAEVSPVHHPHVFSWRNAVTCFSEKSRVKWSSNTPGRRLSQSTPRKQTFTPRARSLGMSPLLASPMDGSVSFSFSESSCSDSSFTEDETTKQIRTNLIPSFLADTNA